MSGVVKGWNAPLRDVEKYDKTETPSADAAENMPENPPAEGVGNGAQASAAKETVRLPDTKDYVRAYIVRACPATRGEYAACRGLRIPEGADPAEEGYLVRTDGHVSWCPKDRFEETTSAESLYAALEHFHNEHYSRLHEMEDETVKRLCRAFYREYTLLGEEHALTFGAVSSPVDGMTFGQAIEAMKQKKKVSRAAWYGQNRYISILPSGKIIDCIKVREKQVEGKENGDVRYYKDWTASHEDVLAEDWKIVD